MLRVLYKEDLTPKLAFPPCDNNLVLTESVEQNGVLSNVSKVKCSNILKDYGHFSYRDFDIRNLQAVGALKEMSVVVTPTNSFGVIDTIASLPNPPENS